MTDETRRAQGVTSRLVRNPVAIECARAAASFAGGPAEVVVFEADHVFVAARSDSRGALLPRSMNASEAALVAAGGRESCVSFDGAVCTAIRDRSGALVAALTLWSPELDVDPAATLALARLVESSLHDSSEQPAGDFHAEVLRGQRDAVLVLTSELEIRWVSAGVGSLVGRTADEVIGRSAVEFLHPDDVVNTLDAVTRISQGLEMHRVNVRLLNSGGDYTPVEVTGTDMSDHPVVGGLVLSLRDAQHESELGKAIDRARRTSDAIVGGLRDGVVATDEFGAITAINDAARTMFGIDGRLPPAQVDIGQFALVTLDGRPHGILGSTARAATSCLLVSPDRDVRYIDVSSQEVADGTSTLGNVVIFSDRTTEHRSAAELRRQALHDQLTGLANRRQLGQRLDELTSAVSINVAACFIDMDAFKSVNDMHGHRAGDELVRVAAQRLDAEIGDADLLVRQGGDEFVALLIDVADLDEAAATAERCRRSLAEPYEIGGRRFDLTASVGVAVMSTDDFDGDQLLQRADLALYAAKDRGRNRVEVFDEAFEAAAINEEFQRRLLREALDEERLVMHFQPLFDAQTETVVGYEALARVRDLDGEMLGPTAFMSGIEGTSLMWDLDRAAFELSCEAAAMFARLVPDRTPFIACNFSPVSVNHPEFLEFVDLTVRAAKIDPRLISIELTESAAFDAGELGRAALSAVADRGFRIALDDFGTGYSSLTHIRDLPITSIKVDRSFVVRLAAGSNERSITEAVVRLAEDLEIGVVAEGVETSEQLEQARELGISTIQGWYFSRAIPLNECLQAWVGGGTVSSNAPIG